MRSDNDTWDITTSVDAEFQAARDEERATGNEDTFFTLVYNEQHASAVDWFGRRGRQGAAVRLADYFRQIGRPVNGSLVSAVKE
ncbi:MAG: hypothetical protein ACRDU5_03600 [Mycobacterium sp.]